MARTALDAGQVETARRLYRRMLQVDATSVDARMGLGDAAVASRESAEAARWYLAALANARKPDDRHAALLAHGRAALSAGQLEPARRSFSRLTRADEEAPESTAAWGFNGLGLTLLLSGDLRGAAAAMEQAVLRAPDEARFQGNLTRALAMLTELDDPAPEVALAGASGGAPPAGPAALLEPATAEPTVPDAPVLAEGNALPDPPAPIAATDGFEVAIDPPPGRVAGAAAPESPAEETDTAPPERVAETIVAAPAESDGEPTESPAEAPGDVPVQPAAPEVIAAEQGSRVRTADRPTAAPPPGDTHPDTVETGSGSGAVPEPGAAAPEDEAPFVVPDDPWTVVEVAAYASRTRAQRLSERLRTLIDDPVWVSETQGPNGAVVARVRVRPYPSRDALAALGATLEAEGFAPLRIPDSFEAQAASAGAPPFVVMENGARFVQAGAYAIRPAAEELAARLAALTERPARVRESRLPGGPPAFRVRIGPLANPVDLTDVADLLEAHGYGRTVIPTPPRDAGARSDSPPMVVRDGGRRFVQTAAFASPDTAHKVADALRRLTDQPVQVEEATGSNGGMVHRVRIGPVASDEALVDLAGALEVAGYGVMDLAAALDGNAARPPDAEAGESRPLVLRQDGERFLQAGAYRAQETAEEMAERLRARVELAVHVTPVDRPAGPVLYRVRIGPIAPDTSMPGLLEAVDAAQRRE